MSTLRFYPTDVGFSKNLYALRESRLSKRKFTFDFDVRIEGRPVKAAKSAYVKGDGETFEYDGFRIPLEKVIWVSYRL